MSWLGKANQIVDKIRKYMQDQDGWKTYKSTKDVTVMVKPSPDWSGALYKAEATMNADPMTVFKYIEPTPEGPRSRWDKAIKELQIIEKVNQDVSVVRTITHSAFGGLISARDFTDLAVTVRTDEYISTNAEGVEHPDCQPSSDHVRGTNYPCAIICYKVPDDPEKTRVASYIQTDLGGMLPKSLVEGALPSNMCDFFSSLKKALQDDGHWKGADVVHENGN